MKTQEIRKQLLTLKIHTDQIERWLSQTKDMIYRIEENLMDVEDEHLDAMLLAMKAQRPKVLN